MVYEAPSFCYSVSNLGRLGLCLGFRLFQGCVNVGVNGDALAGRDQLSEKSDLLAIEGEDEVEEEDPRRDGGGELLPQEGAPHGCRG